MSEKSDSFANNSKIREFLKSSNSMPEKASANRSIVSEYCTLTHFAIMFKAHLPLEEQRLWSSSCWDILRLLSDDKFE
jgi:hypothetical protein